MFFRSILFLITGLLVSFVTTAQDGQLFIKNYPESVNYSEQFWAFEQDQNQNLILAGRKGLFVFDGNHWQKINFESIPFSLKMHPENNQIYVGGINSYGYISVNKYGAYEYTSLNDNTVKANYTNIYFDEEDVYFYGPEHIARHKLNDNSKDLTWLPKNEEHFTGMLITPKNIFFNVSNKGLYRLESDTLFPIVTGFWLEQDEILFSLPYNDERILMGTTNNKLYLFDGIKFYNYKFKDEDYINENLLASGAVLGEDKYVFSTLTGGLIIVDKYKKKIIERLNYQTGLPDNEIYSVFVDRKEGIWASHEFGLSRIDSKLPLRNYSIYPGIEGKIISLTQLDATLYVATNDGVYYLTEVKDFEDVEVLVKAKTKQSTKKKTTPVVTQEEKKETKSDRKFFSRLFNRKKDKKKEEEEPVTKKETPKKKTQKKSQPKYYKKKVSVLSSISHAYKKIEDLDVKVRQMINAKQGILVASNSGLYYIEENKAKAIIQNKYINFIECSESGDKFYTATDDAFYTVVNKKGKWEIEKKVQSPYSVYSLSAYDGSFWCGGENKVVKYEEQGFPESNSIKEYMLESAFPEECKLVNYNDTLFAFKESGIFFYEKNSDSFKKYAENVKNFIVTKSSAWIKNNYQWRSLNPEFKDHASSHFLKLFKNIEWLSPSDSSLWLVSNDEVFEIDLKNDIQKMNDLNVFINSIQLADNTILELGKIKLEPDQNSLNMSISAPEFLDPSKVQYQYMVEGLMQDWSAWSGFSDIQLVLNPGNYNVKIKARDLWQNISPTKNIEISIKEPFTSSIWFLLIIGTSALVLFFFVLKIREKKLQRDKRILEQKVKERTIEIEEQKEEIEAQRDEITAQRDEIFRKSSEITASIQYAKRIQAALLPLKDHFKKAFSDHFIFFRPRDIVSGDFYWIAENDDKIVFTAADCTGHGVPGAFMSMLGIASLNEIFITIDDLSASRILELLREKIKFTLHQTGKDGEAKDGMDMALCVIDKKKQTLQFAGAYNPLFMVTDGEFQEIKADRMPIGIHHTEKQNFTNHEVKIKKGDMFYIFSDGFADQFGGPNKTKFKTANFRKLVASFADKTMDEQYNILADTLEEWKGFTEQIDDIIVLGVKI